jgi:hypothetical protein
VQVATPEFETQVLTAFSQKLLEYCDELLRSRQTNGARLLIVSVVTAMPVPGLRARLDDHAARLLGRRLPGARLDQMFFAVDRAIAEPLYAIGVDERPPPAPLPADDDPSPVRLLTLSFGRPHRFVFQLEPSPAWLPFRRGAHAAGLQYEIALPDYLSAVPRGTLLHLRYRRGVVQLRRTAARPEYRVDVDDRELAPDGRAPLADRGRIGFGNHRGRTELRYAQMELL